MTESKKSIEKKPKTAVNKDTANEKTMPEIKPGMTVRVHQRITEKSKKGEEKERIQVFEGLVISHKHGKEIGNTITVRKETGGISVEKIFPLNSPVISKIEPVRQAKVRRANLSYLRHGYKKRLREKTID